LSPFLGVIIVKNTL